MRILFCWLMLCVAFTIDVGAQDVWRQQSPLPTSHHLMDVCNAGADAQFAVGARGTILKSTDQGSTWQLQASMRTTELISVSFCDARNGIVAGTSGLLLRTTDAGVSWLQLSSGVLTTIVRSCRTGLWIDIRGNYTQSDHLITRPI